MKTKRIIALVLAVLMVVPMMVTVSSVSAESPGLVNSLYRLQNDKELTVGYYGGSVTVGSGSSDASLFSWRALTRDWIRDTFPEANVIERNAAIGGTGMIYNIFRAEKDFIKDKAPDLIFIEMAINDSYDGITGTNVQYVYIETLLRKIYRSNPKAEVVFVVTGDVSTFIKEIESPTTPYFGKAYTNIAAHYNLPVIYVGRALAMKYKEADLADDGVLNTMVSTKTGNEIIQTDLWKKYGNKGDIVHLSDAGYKVYADTIIAELRTMLPTTYVPRSSEYKNITLPSTLYCVDNSKNEGELTVDKLMDANIVRGEELDDAALGSFTVDYKAYAGFKSLYSTAQGSKISLCFNTSNIRLWTYERTQATSMSYSVDGATARNLTLSQQYNNGWRSHDISIGIGESNHTIDIEQTGTNDMEILGLLLWDAPEGQTPTAYIAGSNAVKVSFMKNDGTDTVLGSGSYDVGDPVSIPSNPTRAGYTFVGWSLANDSKITVTPDTVASSSKNYYAVWEYGGATITFRRNSNKTGIISKTEYEKGDPIVLPANPKRVGYTFVGWSTDKNATTAQTITTATGDTTYYEVWKTAIPKVIYVDAASGSDSNSGASSALAVKTLAKAGELGATEVKIVGSYSTSNTEKFGGIKITGATGTSDSITLTTGMLDADVEIDNITIANNSNSYVFQSKDNSITLGSGVATTNSTGILTFTNATLEEPTITVKGGTYKQLQFAKDGGDISGSANIVVDGATISDGIYPAHKWAANDAATTSNMYGTYRITVNSGTVGKIYLAATYWRQQVVAKGLRYITLNGGTVGDVSYAVQCGANGAYYNGIKPTGVNVVEVNDGATVTGQFTIGDKELLGFRDASVNVVILNGKHASKDYTFQDKSLVSIIKAKGAKLSAVATEPTEENNWTSKILGYTWQDAASDAIITITEEGSSTPTIYNASEISMIPASDIKMGTTTTVEFAAEESTFKFMRNDGTDAVISEANYGAGEAVAVPSTPTRTGYHFKGWAESAKGAVVTPVATATTDKTYYAIWVKSGDANQDGDINILDALAVFRVIAGKEAPSAFEKQVIDLTGDGNNNVLDVIRLFKAISE